MLKNSIAIKLIVIFVLIKVIPLILLGLFSWKEIDGLGVTVSEHTRKTVKDTQDVVSKVGSLATNNSIHALDRRSREAIERLTTDTARAVASFLYERDKDILLVSKIKPDRKNYERFLDFRTGTVVEHEPWVIDSEGRNWIPVAPKKEKAVLVTAGLDDNRKEFHSRPPDDVGIKVEKPLYLELTFLDTVGKELIKVVKRPDILPTENRNISIKENTYCRAETYFQAIKDLKPGEIYVSKMIGPYVKAHMIGTYNKVRAEKMGIDFNPQDSGYAGKENPAGKKFQGLIRWVTPVVGDGKIQGYVTLALDHTHLMEFTDHIIPTEERYSAISDASTGNYAFMWDYLGRNISHPRDYFIVGYDPNTGEPNPWLDQETYAQWKKSNLPVSEFLKTVPIFFEQSLKKKPAAEQIKSGILGLDGRYLNFAPQCAGWHNLTQYGGSGSFVIYWSNLWKLTTAATIPYYTGIYGKTPRGFGYITVGANVHEFHKAATETGRQIEILQKRYEDRLNKTSLENQEKIRLSLKETTRDLTLYTGIMVLMVITIAVWMASFLTRTITGMINDVRRFQDGELEHRISVYSNDEIGQLGKAFNDMAASLNERTRDLEESERKYRSIFENAMEGIFQSAADGRLISANPALAGICGYDSPEDMLTSITSIDKQAYADRRDRIRFNRLLLQNGQVIGFEAQIVRKDGSLLWGSLSARAVNDAHGNLLYYEGTLADITERIEREKAEKDREIAIAANKAKSRFLANMSHEIRTPMNAIIGFNNLALKTELTEKQKNYLTKIGSSANLLLTIINDILDFSKIEAGKLHLEHVNFSLTEVLNTLSDQIAIKAEEKSLELIYDIDEKLPNHLIGDPLRLGQVLLNLASNAVKFTEKGEIVLSISLISEILSEPEDIVVLKFSMKDTGIGLTETQIKKLFRSFSQADGSTTRKYGGSGLGLAICKRMVEMMNGDIWVESQFGRGSTFFFSAQFQRRSDEKNTDDSTPIHLSNRRVLVVDDNATSREIFAGVLSSLSFDVSQAVSAQQAIAKIENADKHYPYDLVIMDWKMPGMDGIQATEYIHHRLKPATIPEILMVGAYGREDIMKKAVRAGINHFLIKPVNPCILIDTVIDIFNRGPEKKESKKPVYHETADFEGKLRGVNVLLVEDNSLNQQVAIEILKDRGLVVDLAVNGKEAVEKVIKSSNIYDAVLMDLQMPEMDGYEATRKIRKDERFKDLPIIAMTAHAIVEEREKCLDAGMNDHVAKPIDTDKLFYSLAKWIKISKKSSDIPERDRHGKTDNNDVYFPPDLPGLDVEQVLKRLRGNSKLLKSILTQFSSMYKTVADDIQKCLEKGAVEESRNLVHTVKGIAGNISANTLYLSAVDLEDAIKNSRNERYHDLLEKFRNALSEVLASISSL